MTWREACWRVRREDLDLALVARTFDLASDPPEDEELLEASLAEQYRELAELESEVSGNGDHGEEKPGTTGSKTPRRGEKAPYLPQTVRKVDGEGPGGPRVSVEGQGRLRGRGLPGDAATGLLTRDSIR